MRFKFSFLFATVGALCLAAMAFAQQEQQGGRGRGPGGPPMFPGGGGMGANRMFLLSVAEVRKELELADEQVDAITKLAEELRAKYPSPFGGRGPGGGDRGKRGNNNEGALRTAPSSWFLVAQEAQNQPGQNRGRGGNFQFQPPTPEQRAEFEKQMQDRAREEKEKLAEILLPHQIKRLTEIFIQQAGAAALQDEDVAKEVGISDAQKAKLAEVRQANQDSSRDQMREAFQLDDDARRAKFEEIRKVSDAKLLAVLTSDQQKKFEALKGKPFAMPEGAFRGRGPGGPGRGGRGGNNN